MVNLSRPLTKVNNWLASFGIQPRFIEARSCSVQISSVGYVSYFSGDQIVAKPGEPVDFGVLKIDKRDSKVSGIVLDENLKPIDAVLVKNGYWADDKVRQVNKLSSQIKEFRSEYISTKSDLMFVSKQSEVAKSAEKLGLKEPIVPPMKIVVDTTKENKQEATNTDKE